MMMCLLWRAKSCANSRQCLNRTLGNRGWDNGRYRSVKGLRDQMTSARTAPGSRTCVRTSPHNARAAHGNQCNVAERGECFTPTVRGTIGVIFVPDRSQKCFGSKRGCRIASQGVGSWDGGPSCRSVARLPRDTKSQGWCTPPARGAGQQ
jgi:hypothetical protein